MKNLSIVLSLVFLFIACNATKNLSKAPPYVGSWEVLVRGTPDGDISSILMIKKEEDNYTAIISNDDVNIKASTVKVMEGKLTLEAYVEAYNTYIEIDVQLDDTKKAFKGYLNGELPVEGKKMELNP